MRAHERCHVRDCTVKISVPEAPIFRIPGDMRHLPLVLSSVAKRFRSRKLNFMCKAHFLPEDLLLTRSGICLSKKAVPCLQVPRRTLEMILRSAISPKHSEVAGALLERNRSVALKNAGDSSSDSDCPSESMSNPPISSQSPTDGSYFPVVDSTLASGLEENSPFTNNLTLQERLQLAGAPDFNGGVSTCANDSNGKAVKRYGGNFISRDEDCNFVDYKRIKVSDSDSPRSQPASENSNANSRAEDDDDDDEEDDDEDADDEMIEEGEKTLQHDGERMLQEDRDGNHGRLRPDDPVIDDLVTVPLTAAPLAQHD